MVRHPRGGREQMTLEGKVAIVTGAAGDIGEAIAGHLLREGARVVIADLDHAGGDALEARLASLGGVQFLKANVAQRLDVHNLLAAALDNFGDVDLLVTCSGATQAAPLLDLAEDQLDEVFAANFRGAFLAGQAVGRYLSERVGKGGAAGAIVHVDAAGLGSRQDAPASAMARGALVALTRSMAEALAPYAVRVNAIVARPRQRPAVTDALGLSTTRPTGPADIAAIVGHLVSDAGQGLSGEILHADATVLPVRRGT